MPSSPNSRVVLFDADGVLVDSHDPQVWATVLAGLLDDPARRERLGRQAARRAEGFGWGATAEATLELYSEAVAARHGS